MKFIFFQAGIVIEKESDLNLVSLATGSSICIESESESDLKSKKYHIFLRFILLKIYFSKKISVLLFMG